MAAAGESFDGADQGLLNQYYEHRPWQRLKFTYNCTPNAEYQWEPAYRYYKKDISAVHFIGKDKPWSNNRTAGHGVYGELLARWWAVHNRHLHDQPKAAVQESQRTSEVQSSTNTALQPQHVPEITVHEPAPTAEPSLTDPSEVAEDIDQGLAEPTPTVQQRKFSAPVMEWDATKFEPPAQSKPEAANFPSETYTFNESRELFKAPQAYPEPPRDMWYKVPETKPQPYEPPKPIFPWEREASRPKPTRIWAEDHPPEPASAPAPAPVLEVSEFEASPPPPPPPPSQFTTTHYDNDNDNDKEYRRAKPTRVWRDEPRDFKPRTAEESWQAFSQNSANTWDSIPGIDSYVRSIMDSQAKRGKVQVLQQATGTDDIGSPTLSRKERRESLILTDFPSAVERPSLPVTPAPVRRPTFWGEERDETGELPAAEGVPDQNEWNPGAKLEQLRRSSLVEIEHLKKDEHPDPPLRTLPEHSVLGDEHGEELEVGGIVVAKSNRPAARFSTRQASTEQVASSQHTTKSSTRKAGRSNKTGFTMDDFGTSFEKREKKESGSNPLSGPTFSYEDATPGEAFPKIGGFAERDFGGDSTNEREIQYAISTMSQNSSSTTHRSMGPGHQLTSDGRIKAGELTFNLPGFNSESTSGLVSPTGDALSPTTTREDQSQRSF